MAVAEAAGHPCSKHSSVQLSTAQYSSVQLSTAQYSSVQLSTACPRNQYGLLLESMLLDNANNVVMLT
jgi:hypothetical protein